MLLKSMVIIIWRIPPVFTKNLLRTPLHQERNSGSTDSDGSDFLEWPPGEAGAAAKAKQEGVVHSTGKSDAQIGVLG